MGYFEIWNWIMVAFVGIISQILFLFIIISIMVFSLKMLLGITFFPKRNIPKEII